jgi:putative flavoprotein involved in K+ transport
MAKQMPVIVIGAGHAGLALSYELGRAGVEHVVLERSRIGSSWASRWDSFCLVTPNWTVQLPGDDGHPDPDGFMPKDEIVSYLEGYARSFDAPVQLGVDVSSIEPGPSRRFMLRTSQGDMESDTIVLAAGPYQKPHRPQGAASLPPDVYAIDAEAYTAPEDLPPGRVLVVGSGQTGCQIAEELNEAGRDVVLACGRAPWFHRRLEDRDFTAWVAETSFLEHTLDVLPPGARLGANVQASGHGGGHDLHYRTLLAQGVKLAGHFLGVADGTVGFAPDLAESVAFGDARYTDLGNLIKKTRQERGETVPDIPPPEPFTAEGPATMALGDCGAVVFTSGFRPDFTSWVHFPSAFGDDGFPVQTDGRSDVVPGLFFMGVHFMRKRKSATFIGPSEDAPIVAEGIRSSRSA